MPEVVSVRDLRRAQVVAAARGLVAEAGLEGLTFAALERRLEFTRGLITYHFRNKADLELAVLESAVAEIDAAAAQAVEASDTLRGKVEAVIRAMIRGFVDQEEAAVVLLSFWGRLRIDRQAAEANAGLYARYRKGFVELLCRSDGSCMVEVDVEALATVVVGLVIGIVTQHRFEPGAVNVDHAVDEAVRVVEARLFPSS